MTVCVPARLRAMHAEQDWCPLSPGVRLRVRHQVRLAPRTRILSSSQERGSGRRGKWLRLLKGAV
jgi:hypothetical protein